MTKLDCDVVSCSYNENNCCKKQDIVVEGRHAHVSSETACGSFVPKTAKGAVNTTGHATKETEVKCDAKECKFNKNRVCSASHIGISGGHASTYKETACASFVS